MGLQQSDCRHVSAHKLDNAQHQAGKFQLLRRVRPNRPELRPEDGRADAGSYVHGRLSGSSTWISPGSSTSALTETGHTTARQGCKFVPRRGANHQKPRLHHPSTSKETGRLAPSATHPREQDAQLHSALTQGCVFLPKGWSHILRKRKTQHPSLPEAPGEKHKTQPPSLPASRFLRSEALDKHGQTPVP